MRRIIHILSIGGIVITFVWACFDFGFGSVSGVIASLVAFLSSIQKPVSNHSIAPPAADLSYTARRVLGEIDASDKSDPKGVSIMMMGSTVALYRPFIWDNHLHGSISGHEGYDPSGTVSAIDELIDSGFLIPHHVGSSLLQWRRTTRRRS